MSVMITTTQLARAMSTGTNHTAVNRSVGSTSSQRPAA
jgi:hypothetical protein